LPARHTVLDIVGLTGGWGPTTIVERLDLAVAAGETVAVVGRNGVGKTTLLELIAGRAQQRSGEIRLSGRDIGRLPIHQRAHAGIGYVPQQREVFRSLTVKEHLAIAARPGEWSEAAVLELRIHDLVNEAYNNLAPSIHAGDGWLPEQDVVLREAQQYLPSIQVEKVNSENDVKNLLDRQGQLELRNRLEVAQFEFGHAATGFLLDENDRPIVDTLCDRLASQHKLLVLDNCEHLGAACAALVQRVIGAAPGVRVLAASREGLSVPGERTVTVRSLSFPPPGSKLDPRAVDACEAVRLFVERARRLVPKFSLGDDSRDAVAEICRRLDGIPLAEKRCPLGCCGLYKTGVRTGWSAFDTPTWSLTFPYPEMPVPAPLTITTSPFGRSTASAIVRACGICSTCQPAVMPSSVRTMREH